MADEDNVTLGKINYWMREKHYHHVLQAVQEGLQKYGNDPILRFFQAVANMMTGDRLSDGMRELETMKDKRDLNLCATMALIYGHKKARTIDREAVTQLDSKLKDERKQAGEKGLYFGGLFMFHTGKYDKTREYVDRAIKINPQYKQALALRGWQELMMARDAAGREANVKKSVQYFDDALGQEGIKDIDALFGKARYCEAKKHFGGALDLYNQAVVSFPNFLPALIEKMKTQLALQDWEQTVETAQRCLSIDSSCLHAQRYIILHLLCKEGNYQEAANKLGELMGHMDRVEPRNSYLFDDFAKVFCRVSGRNALVLQQTYYMAERAMTSEQGQADYMTELGYQLLMQGKVKDAIKCYRNAMKIDESSVPALTGVIRCQLLENQLEEATQQIEFLNEIQQSLGISTELSYLSAVLSMKKMHSPDKIMSTLSKAIDTHFAGLKGLPLGTDYFFHLNPDFLIQVVGDYLTFAPQQPVQQGQPPSPVLKKCSQVLEPLSRAVPGLLEALYLMAKVKFLSGEVEVAQSTLQHCLDRDQTFSDGHILMAQIHLHQNNFKLANQSLEIGLSYNFEVREHPLYHLIKARILKKQGELEEAAKTLQMAMTLPGVKTTGNRLNAASLKKKTINISTNDRVSVFIELADAHRQLDEQHEAAKVMQDAINQFQGTGEEVRITISNVDLALNRGDVEGALAMLRNIQPDQPYFVQAREKMAEIYLHHRKDKRLYASCYRELVDKFPNTQTSLLLGDAYMSIQEPELAIQVYEGALKKNPRDSALATKIGQALVKTHNYGKAINYYESALKSGTQQFLRHDLAELLMKLRQFDKAEKVLKIALDQDANASDLEVMMEHTRYYVLLSHIYKKQDQTENSILCLNKAKEMQSRVLKRAQVEQPDAFQAQKQLAASICVQMAQHSAQQRDYDKAIKLYKEALSHTESDGKIMLELAKLYLTTEDLDACQHQCMTLVKNDTENDAATVMLADLMFKKNEYDQATYHFQQLLERKPDHYEALARLVDLLRRAGKIEDIPKFLETAENSNPRAHIEGGFNYCKGLYEWFQGNPNNALKYFNKSRKDSEFGTKAMYIMIEICLNPDSETIGGEVFESVENELGQASEKADQDQVALRTAEKLLKELRPKPSNIKGRVLENLALVATKNKANVEKAIQNLMELCSSEHEYVGALYAMAAAYMVLKQSPRARNQLKRVTKSIWNIEDAEDLERSWLLLSDIYIQSGKYDMATDLLKKCLQYNKSCCKAYEYMGFIMEKEQSYKDASKNYEMAWKYGNKSSPNIGYKLSFNYLKAKRYVDAIDICHHVLGNHPNYPKIRKDILDKARASLRV